MAVATLTEVTFRECGELTIGQFAAIVYHRHSDQTP
jgi:hypothetical protein